MTILHAQLSGDKAMLPRKEFERLLELARRSEAITLETEADEAPAVGVMKLAEQAGAFEWLAKEEDLYSVNDLKVRYR